MSWQASGYVKGLTHSCTGKQIERGEKLILLLLADYTHPDTGWAYPSLDTLAHEGLYEERQVRRIIDSLEDKQFIEIERSEGRKTHRYRILGVPQSPGATRTKSPGATRTKSPGSTRTKSPGSTRTKSPGSVEGNVDILNHPTRTFSPRNVDILGSNPDIAMSTEPIAYKAAQDLKGEDPLPEDLPSVVFANRVAEELLLRQHGINFVIADAIEWLVKYENKTKNDSVMFLISTGREAQKRGEKMRFWFTDHGWIIKSNGKTRREEAIHALYAKDGD